MILALAPDPLTLRKLRSVAGRLGLEIEVAATPTAAGAEPVCVVISLESEGWADSVAATKSMWPLTMVVGVLALPEPGLWSDAETAGCDLVVTRGALGKALPTRLRAWIESPGGRRLRLFPVADIAGRLGVVQRLDNPETGPLAVYHIGSDILAVSDVCPHAGAMLSHGEVSVDDGVVTCPEHGSRFDTHTGERVRGPADLGIKTYDVVVEDGQAYLLLDSG